MYFEIKIDTYNESFTANKNIVKKLHKLAKELVRVKFQRAGSVWVLRVREGRRFLPNYKCFQMFIKVTLC